jgi:hypothetical protein
MTLSGSGRSFCYIEDELPGADEARIRGEALDVLYDLLRAGKIQAGFPDSNGSSFHSWGVEAPYTQR